MWTEVGNHYFINSVATAVVPESK